MKKNTILYFSSGYSSVHRQIIDAIRLKGNRVIPCLYTLHYTKEMFEHPSDAIIYNTASKMRGMFLWKKRLDSIVDHYDRNIDWEEVAIMHAHLLYTDGYICRELSKRRGIPFIATIRNTDINTSYYSLPQIKREMLKTISLASKIIYLSPNYRDSLLKRVSKELLPHLTNKMMYIPNGIDIFWHENRNSHPRQKDDECITLLTVGRIESNKNQLQVCKAASELIRKGYSIKYTMVGDCSDPVLKKKILSYNWTVIIPFQEKHNLINYYRDSDIFIMTSKTETFGLVYVEALTQGVPIIYSKGQGFDGQFDEGVVGYHTDSNDIKDIEKAIVRVYEHYNEISERCSSMSSRYTWDRVGELFEKAYRESLNGNDNTL